MLTRLIQSGAAQGLRTQARLLANAPSSTNNFNYYKPKGGRKPLSPFYIYAPQVSSVLSIANRVSGVALTGLVYGASISYLFAGSATALVASFAALPLLLKFPIKLAWIAPNVYHLAAGLRHLDWDLNKSLSLPQMYSSARLAVFFTGAASLYFLGSAIFGDSKKKSH